MLQEVVTTAHDCSICLLGNIWIIGLGGWERRMGVGREKEEDPKKVSVSCDGDLSHENGETKLKDGAEVLSSR